MVDEPAGIRHVPFPAISEHTPEVGANRNLGHESAVSTEIQQVYSDSYGVACHNRHQRAIDSEVKTLGEDQYTNNVCCHPEHREYREPAETP